MVKQQIYILGNKVTQSLHPGTQHAHNQSADIEDPTQDHSLEVDCTLSKCTTFHVTYAPPITCASANIVHS